MVRCAPTRTNAGICAWCKKELGRDDREPRDLWDPSGRYLVCSSHGARYQPSDGLCVGGPCEGSHLKALPIEVQDGEVFLDTSKIGSFFDV